VDQGIHRDDVREFAQLRIEHIASVPIDPAVTDEARCAFARNLDQSAGDIDAGHFRTAASGCNAQRTGSAARVEHARAAQIGRQP